VAGQYLEEVNSSAVFVVAGVDGQALDVINIVDIRPESNFELAMRLKTDVTNDDFYSDLNGFQVLLLFYHPDNILKHCSYNSCSLCKNQCTTNQPSYEISMYVDGGSRLDE